MYAIVFSILSYIGWGSGDIFAAIGSRKIGGTSFAVWSIIVGLILSAFYAPFAPGGFAGVPFWIILLNILLAFLITGAWFTFNKALEIGNASLVGAIGASFAPLVVVLSTVFLGESITVRQILAIVIIFTGLILSVVDFKTIFKRSTYNKGVLLALLTMLLWGIYFTFIKIPINHMGWFWPSMVSLSFGPLMLVYFKIKKVKIESPLKHKALPAIITSSILATVGSFSFSLAVSKGLTSIVAPIAGSYPTLYVFLAFLIFKDKITKQQLIGIIVTVLGIVLLSVLGST